VLAQKSLGEILVEVEEDVRWRVWENQQYERMSHQLGRMVNRVAG
jgi:hypothetical protein